MEMIKKNITLIVGISIPILMILFVASSIYLPGFFVQPKYNFLYTNGNAYYFGEKFSIQNGKLVKNEIKPPAGQNYNTPRVEAKLYVYNVVKNESTEISFESALVLNLDSSVKSPDGLEIVYGNRSEGIFPFFFWTDMDYSSRYLKGHNTAKKLNLQPGFQFLGWIKN